MVPVFPLRSLDHEFRDWRHVKIRMVGGTGSGYSMSLVAINGFLPGCFSLLVQYGDDRLYYFLLTDDDSH